VYTISVLFSNIRPDWSRTGHVTTPTERKRK